MCREEVARDEVGEDESGSESVYWSPSTSLEDSDV